MTRNVLILLSILVILIGCHQKEFLDKFSLEEEINFAKQYLAWFQSRHFDAIEDKINPKLINEQLRGKLEQIATLFPKVKPDLYSSS